MKQTGTLYSIANNENSVEIKQPIPNVFIYFSQNNVRKLTTKTDAQGKFSFDLPLGSYQVAVSQGATSQVYQLAGGAPFELTSASKENAFEQWVLAPVYLKPEENPLVILMNELVKDARDSATKAKAEADRAEQAVGDTVGTGKLMREGAFGLGDSALIDYKNLNDFMGSGFYVQNLRDAGSTENNFPINNFAGTVINNRINRATEWGTQIAFSRSRAFFRTGDYNSVGTNWWAWCEIYHDKNTTVDSNGFIKAASPIIKLFDTHIEANDSFKEEPIFEKLDTGVYQIKNTLGLAKDGWYIETPRDRNGLPYFLIEWYQDEDNTVTIEVFKKKLNLETLEFENGEHVDIGKDQRWIDLRFHEEEEALEDE